MSVAALVRPGGLLRRVPLIAVQRTGSRRTIITRSARRVEHSSGDLRRRPVTTIVVIVPARNEAAHLPACLHSIDRAAAEWGGQVIVAVGLDSCTDGSALVVEQFRAASATVVAVSGRWHGASRARRAATQVALAEAGDGADHVWLANTDADCVVPIDWLQAQAAAAAAGADVVLGTVDLDPAETPAALLARFRSTYVVHGEAHPHVHAANLGIRASAYAVLGGWRTSTLVGEEHRLVQRARSRDLCVVAPVDLAVVTSSRLNSRVPGGFATALAQHAGGGDGV